MPSSPCCGSSTCSCVITAGSNIRVEGSGTVADPIVITAEFPDSILTVRDSNTVTLRLTGDTESGLVLQADSALKVTDLKDISPSAGVPATGQTLVYQADGTWAYGTAPSPPAGTVNVGPGITGTGGVSTPLIAAVSGVWGVAPLNGLGSDKTIGLPVYVDDAGQLRAEPAVAFLKWANIPDKPTTFPPSPSATYTASQITDLSTNGDAAKVQGHQVFTAQTSTPTPTGGNVNDVFLFPRGS